MNRTHIAAALVAIGTHTSGYAVVYHTQDLSANSVTDSAFIKDSQMMLSVKNYQKYLKESNSGPTHVHNAWGQGFSADYQSGYLFDFIGVDAVYYSAVKLGASDYFNTRGVLYNHGTGNKKSNAQGYSKFGQRNIKLKYDSNDMQLKARWGWQLLKNFGVISTSMRLSPTTYSGWSGSFNYGDFTLRGVYVENSMDRNSPDKKQFQTNNGKKIDHLASGDMLWESPLLDVQYGFGESDNYLRRHVLFTTLKPDRHLNVRTQLYATHALDEYTAMPASKRDFDNNAWHFALDATWKGERWSSKTGVGYTSAKKSHEVGFYPRHMSKNSRGTFISMAYAGDDYMRDGELMLANITDYKLTPEVSIGLAGNIGQFNYKNNHVRTGEISAFSRWVPTDPTFKNLTLWAMLGPGWSYRSHGKTPVLKKGRYTRTQTLSTELIIEYRFQLF